MSLDTSPLYDAWIDVLTDAGLAEETARQLVDSIIGDPRIVHTSRQTETAVQELRTLLSTIIDEYRLDEFEPIERHETIRDALLESFDETVDTATAGADIETAPTGPTGPGPDTSFLQSAQRGYNTEADREDVEPEMEGGEGTPTITSASQLQELIEAADLTSNQIEALIEVLQRELKEEKR